jgi:hypothetical protein
MCVMVMVWDGYVDENGLKLDELYFYIILVTTCIGNHNLILGLFDYILCIPPNNT